MANPVQSVERVLDIIPVVVSGGMGARLWPLSRELHPKPFIPLPDGESLIQKTYLRALLACEPREILTVTNRNLFFLTKDEYEKIGAQAVPHTYLLEPFGRNSAAAIALAAHDIANRLGKDTLLLVLPADHLIHNQEGFANAIAQAAELAREGKLVTFGITPLSPHTGYGYIEAEGTNVLRFVEKPDAETAQAYIESGNFFWNAGIFCMQAGTILEEMALLSPDIYKSTRESLKPATQIQGNGWTQTEISAEQFEKTPNISVDYAVFERSQKVAIVPADLGWSDIGSWAELGNLYPKDAENNHSVGEVILEDVKTSILHGSGRLIAGLGIEDLVIADTADAVLVAHKDRLQDVRKIVDRLKASGFPHHKTFPTVYRPWGSYTVLLEDQGFKLKRICVKPGAALSLQSHKYRNEHWVVVSGVAKVTNGDEVLTLKYNESTYIPVSNRHRLENPGESLLELIEVQCGSYLGEDDIIRYEDIYGRTA